jgi:AcrR family transcriptional regulator
VGQSGAGQRGPGTRPATVARRRERADRILDAAAELTLRWGYDKTTVDDVARLADVAKGTIYLHWTSREALFLAMLRREQLALAGDVARRVTEDPAPSTMRSLLTHSVLVYQERPLLKAVLVRDMDVLGRLVRSGQAGNARGPVHSGFVGYLGILRDHGWVRTDQSLADQVNLISALFVGFFVMAPVLPDEFTLSDQQAAPLLADAVCRAVERADPLTSNEAAGLARATDEWLERALVEAENKYRAASGDDALGEESAR